jgi:hypothetical protein
VIDGAYNASVTGNAIGAASETGSYGGPASCFLGSGVRYGVGRYSGTIQDGWSTWIYDEDVCYPY